MPESDGQFQHGEEGAPQSGASGHSAWVALLYSELRAIAQAALNGERRQHTLSATALVNEVYLKLSGSGGTIGATAQDGVHPIPQLDRAAFFGAAAQAMRRILVDHARGKKRQKRGGGVRVNGGDALEAVANPSSETPFDAVELDEALVRLATEHADAARVVELRFFAGLPERGIAEVMNIHERTVRRHWTFAKAWLARELNPDRDPPPPASGDST
jgi:RNA polymerase sigma factor (TIGR02999 family)